MNPSTDLSEEDRSLTESAGGTKIVRRFATAKPHNMNAVSPKLTTACDTMFET